MFKNGIRPVHPGEVLHEDYLKPLGLSVNALAKALDVPTSRMYDIVHERRGVSADTALRLERYFGSDAQGWLNMQTAFDLKLAKMAESKAIERDIVPMAMTVRVKNKTAANVRGIVKAPKGRVLTVEEMRP